MKKIFSILAFLSIFTAVFASRPPYSDPNQPINVRISDLLSRMSLQEKISLLSGHGFDVSGIKRLSIPSLKMSDGPAGVRWGISTAFPAPIALAATWDPKTVEEVGKAMGTELRVKGRNVFLAPCVNIHRIPLGGRNFESYGEDPFLAGEIAAAFIKGVQSRKAIACVKHYTANNQEWERTRVDVIVSERALQEIYTPAFRAAVQKGGALCVMAAYNKVNGEYCSENKHLLLDLLKGEMHFKGFVVSDWGATHSTVKAALSGLDIEMPYGVHFGKKLLEAVKEGKVPEKVIDDKVRRILYAMFVSGLFDEKESPPAVDWKKHALLARKVASESMVLLKNNGILPFRLDKIHSIALIGPNAKYPMTGGGGSAMVTPPYSVSPLEAFKKLEKTGIKVFYVPGTEIYGDVLPVESKYLKYKDRSGLLGEYYNNPDLQGEPILKRLDQMLYFHWSYELPDPRLEKGNQHHRVSIRWKGFLLPPATGTYTLKFLCDGGVRVYVDKKLVLNSWDENNRKRRVILRKARVELEAGKKTPIKIEYSSYPGISEFKFAWEVPGENLQDEAVKLAKKADVVVFIGGLSPHFETESHDRETMDIPNQSRLIKRLSKVNPNLVVVLISGSPVTVSDWINRVAAAVEAWYPGQEEGNALLDVLTGKVNPSGKLPFSWYASGKDCPGLKGYKSQDLKARYQEGIFVGYRYLVTKGIKPAFPFGHGLSYTRFEYSDLEIKGNSKGLMVKFTVKNSGSLPGKEVAQVYVSAPRDGVPRPAMELKAFKKISLEPGHKTRVSLFIPMRSLMYFDPRKGQWSLTHGTYTILVGSSSEDIRLKGTVNI